MKKFNLRFQLKEISKWADKYDTRQNGNQNLREKERQVKIIGNVNKRKHLTKSEFLNLCQWKSPRIVHHCEKNTEDFIHTVTKAAFESADEHFRIEVLTLLKGVNWPMASVILHFCSERFYPILDFRALWSLNCKVPNQYTFPFWHAYMDFCNNTAEKAKVGIREFDKALWEYSKENQTKK